jgi:hypothetical protein
MASLRERVWRTVKALWLLVVLGVAAYYFVAHFDELRAGIRAFSIPFVLLSALILSLGKLLLVEVSRRSIDRTAWRPTFQEMFCINSLTQLAKYIPGGIWHFVGRLGAYRASGLGVKKASRAMIVENIWLVLSAAMVGVALSFSYVANKIFGFTRVDLRSLQLPTILILVMVWVVALWLIERFRSGAAAQRLLRTTEDLVLQISIWVLIGGSFLALRAQAENLALLGLVVGSFCLSWAVGYLTVFAPGGLGAREAVLVGVLATIAPAQDTIIWAAVHRIIWVGVELLLGGIAAVLTTTQPQIVQKVLAANAQKNQAADELSR